MATKDELLKQLKDLGVNADPKDTNADLEEQVRKAQAAKDKRHAELSDVDGFGAYCGDTVRVVLTSGWADLLTKREERWFRFVKATVPFEPRAYGEGDYVNGTVVSAYDDGTATVDLRIEGLPRVTLDRVPLGDGAGHYQRKD